MCACGSLSRSVRQHMDLAGVESVEPCEGATARSRAGVMGRDGGMDACGAPLPLSFMPRSYDADLASSGRHVAPPPLHGVDGRWRAAVSLVNRRSLC